MRPARPTPCACPAAPCGDQGGEGLCSQLGRGRWNDEGETQWYTYEYWNQAQQQEALPRSSAEALSSTRRFTINRAFTPGMQRFPGIVWSGDGSDCSHRMALQFARAGASLITCDMRSNDTGDARQLIQQYQNAVRATRPPPCGAAGEGERQSLHAACARAHRG